VFCISTITAIEEVYDNPIWAACTLDQKQWKGADLFHLKRLASFVSKRNQERE